MVKRHFVALLLGLIFPLILLDVSTLFADWWLLPANLIMVALPHWVSWWFAAKTDALRSAAFLGGLVGANAVLTFFTFGFGSHGPDLWWVFYWPLCIAGMWAGHATAARLAD